MSDVPAQLLDLCLPDQSFSPNLGSFKLVIQEESEKGVEQAAEAAEVKDC